MRTLLGVTVALIAASSLVSCQDGGSTEPDLSVNHSQDLSSPSDGFVQADFSSTDGAVVPGIACGDTPCAANAQFCCTFDQGKTGMCGFGTAVTCGSAVFYCDGPEDCPPADPFCCVQNGVAQCQTGSCGGTVDTGFGMCHATTDCALVGGLCCASAAGGPYKLCLMSCP